MVVNPSHSPPGAFGIEGLRLCPGMVAPDDQAALVVEVFAAAALAPFLRYATAYGGRMSVEMTSFGPLGWTSDSRGRRYRSEHPTTGRPWPAMPAALLDIWRRATSLATPPDSCLVNLYRGSARMGLHQDRDEVDLRAPVVSISLGDSARFRLGGLTRRAPTRAMTLHSGDVVVLAGAARLAFHGIDRILPHTSRLIPEGGRLNLTLRQAGPSIAGTALVGTR